MYIMFGYLLWLLPVASKDGLGYEKCPFLPMRPITMFKIDRYLQ